jgi:acetyl esterase/lipase
MLDDPTTIRDPHIGRWPAGLTTTTPPAGTPCSDRIRKRDIEPASAAGRLKDAAGLPPAYIEVGQLDIFRNEDIRYALTLGQCGVPVELHLHPGVPHEYDAIAFDADVSRRAPG